MSGDDGFENDWQRSEAARYDEECLPSVRASIDRLAGLLGFRRLPRYWAEADDVLGEAVRRMMKEEG